MRDAKHGHDDISHKRGEFLGLQLGGQLARCSGMGCERERVPHRQLREMHIVLTGENSLSSEVSVHLFARYA